LKYLPHLQGVSRRRARALSPGYDSIGRIYCTSTKSGFDDPCLPAHAITEDSCNRRTFIAAER
jgi:hypothetical protein